MSLEGASLGPDSKAKLELYGKKVSGEQIFIGDVKAPAAAQWMLNTLEAKSPKNVSAAK